MPAIRTDITEISTALGMLGYRSVGEALKERPPSILGVSDDLWDRLAGAFAGGLYVADFESALENGRAFLNAPFGLRGRLPIKVEWKGPHKTPGYELIPVDLRIDHVFLISCKYLSNVLFNASPAHLFRRLLAVRHGDVREDWYAVSAPTEYEALYEGICAHLPSLQLPRSLHDLTREDRVAVKGALSGSWPEEIKPLYSAMCGSVSRSSAAIWNSNLATSADRELMLWRLLRIASAPYFVLGASGHATLRLRISTPWDWRQKYSMLDFSVAADHEAGQPVVSWRATVLDREEGTESVVSGHVEIRWSHGRFRGNPEAKIYLDTPHRDVPGYEPLEPAGDSTGQRTLDYFSGSGALDTSGIGMEPARVLGLDGLPGPSQGTQEET
ncbi:MAG: hypothetical protein GEU71_11040 [Actinobacteria bacterium]|nr:hypothetical protein [Actinomycetota bacterium]